MEAKFRFPIYDMYFTYLHIAMKWDTTMGYEHTYLLTCCESLLPFTVSIFIVVVLFSTQPSAVVLCHGYIHSILYPLADVGLGEGLEIDAVGWFQGRPHFA